MDSKEIIVDQTNQNTRYQLYASDFDPENLV